LPNTRCGLIIFAGLPKIVLGIISFLVLFLYRESTALLIVSLGWLNSSLFAFLNEDNPMAFRFLLASVVLVIFFTISRLAKFWFEDLPNFTSVWHGQGLSYPCENKIPNYNNDIKENWHDCLSNCFEITVID